MRHLDKSVAIVPRWRIITRTSAECCELNGSLIRETHSSLDKRMSLK